MVVEWRLVLVVVQLQLLKIYWTNHKFRFILQWMQFDDKNLPLTGSTYGTIGGPYTGAGWMTGAAIN